MQPQTSLCQNLIDFYDDFVRFHDSCAFFMDAMSCLLAEYVEAPYPSLEARGRSEQIKQTAATLRLQLRELQEGCCRAHCSRDSGTPADSNNPQRSF